jgi:peptide deformylase
MYYQRDFRLLTYGPQMNNILARPVEEKEWPDIPGLFKYMREVMRKADGFGLAAPQIGCFRRFILIEMPKGSVLGLLNPEITRLYGREINGLEWCSNVPPPGNESMIPRMGMVDIEASLATAPDYRRKFTFHGRMARIVQHEIDHLDGISFVDRIPSEGRKKSILRMFHNWKSMRLAQIRRIEENHHVDAGVIAASRGQSRLS